MKVVDIIGCGLKDLKAHRKRNRISFGLIFLSVVVYVGVHSTIDGIKNGAYNTVSGHNTRILCMDGTGEAEDEYRYLTEKYKDDERVQEIFKGILYYTGMVWYDTMGVLGEYKQDMFFSTCYESVLNLNYKGENRLPKYDEIILPRYIYEYGIYDEYTCANTDELIGKTLTFRNEAYAYGENEIQEYELKVIGTYDNITKSVHNYPIFANEEFMVEMLEIEAEREISFYIDMGTQVPESVTGNPDLIVYMFIKEGYNISEIQKEINKYAIEDWNKGKDNTLIYKHTYLDEEVEGFYYYIIGLGNVISSILLLLAIINILISSVNEVKDRRWEFALKVAMGYRTSDIIKIFAVEKVANAVKALLVAGIALFMYTTALTYYNQNILEYWKRSWIITVDVSQVVVSLIVAVIASLMGVVIAKESIIGIKVSNTLKAGE